ncbi:MAG: hypothetical protein RMN25_13990 [Anaerolineae bacterium]|nr:hypothetical protein [Thermoflexales bacterium]MDW8408882.1 hypothetical protein [Anaerolineae bacterium]
MDRIIKASAFGIVLCGIVFGFVAGSRIDQSTITLLGGALVGVLLATPCVAAVTWLAARRRDDAWRTQAQFMRHTAPLPPEPPQYWSVQSQPLPVGNRGPNLPVPMTWAGQASPGQTWPGQYDPAGFIPRPRRKFYVIGENGEPQEVTESVGRPLPRDQYDEDDGQESAVF